MGLFDRFKKNEPQKENEQVVQAPETFVPKDEEQYYQPKEYYTDTVFQGTAFERDVIPFNERKKISYPSSRGLYVAEILLLEYCSYGSYPHPKNGYPAFWWFEYGIKDVSAALTSLEKRGFIRFATPLESLERLKVNELREILNRADLPQTGKKTELIARIQENFTDDDLKDYFPDSKYTLTDLGKQELQDNEYVPYMHKAHDKTTDDPTFGPVYNVWEVNRRLYNRPVSEWQKVIEEIRKDQADYQVAKKKEHEQILKDAENWNPEWVAEQRERDKKLEESDKQIQKEQEAKARYKETGDIETYTAFWEDIWASGEPKGGSTRMFTLPDLYIKQKRYDDALDILNQIKSKDTLYLDKADSYIARINNLKDKEKGKQ